jgi:hypothetical protein
MKKVITENEDWKLGCFFDWRPKEKSIECPCCHGEGKVGGGLGDIDGPRDCPQCWGRKYKSVYPTSQKPEIPPALAEHMRRAWYDFFNANTGEE